MARGKCRDCTACRRRGLSKMVHTSIAMGSVFTIPIVNSFLKATTAKVCPICGHRMGLHDHQHAPVAE